MPCIIASDLTPEQISLLVKLKVNVVFAYDSDVSYNDGEVKENMKWKFICGPEFDLTINKNRLMEFTHPISGVKFRISNTYAFIIEDEICGYEAELVEVS